MFQIVAAINFTEISSQRIHIICHVYKNISIGDLLIQVYQNRLYYYTVKKIYGYKDKFYTYAEEGHNYKIEIELPLQFDLNVLENLRYGTYFFGKYNKKCKYSNTLQPNFELLDETEYEQFYQYVFCYKNYNKSMELKNITSIINTLNLYGYDYNYTKKGIKINNTYNYIKNQMSDVNPISSIYMTLENNQFYIHGVIGFESKCKVNRIDIVLPERCRFVDDEINDKLFVMFQEINAKISPFWAYLGNSKSIDRFPHIDANLPTAVHHINYYSKRLTVEIRKIFDVDLPEYLICRKYPFNNLSMNDLCIQKHIYYKYKFDEISTYLQNKMFKSKHDLLLYCNMLEC